MPKKNLKTLNENGRLRFEAIAFAQKNSYAKAAEKYKVDESTIRKWEKWYNDEGAEGLNKRMKPETASSEKIDLEEVEKLILQYQSIDEYDDSRHIRAEILASLAQGFQPNYVAEKFKVTVQFVYQIRLKYLRENKI